jgi:hypothetical protein
MIAVDGIILVLSCQKYLHTRLKNINLKDEYENWKVIYVIGDLFLDCDYKLEGNFMTIKCEDSYIHLLKKYVLSLKYLYEIFDIKEGVLRSGDDLIFNEKLLQTFLESPKQIKINNEYRALDYYGRSGNNQSLLSEDILEEELKKIRIDYFMVDYYRLHPQDIDNPQHNLKGIDVSKYVIRPEIRIGIAGVVCYLSNKSCKILINHMENINYNVFHYDEYTCSYPYTIEDCGVAFILFLNKISLINNEFFWTNIKECKCDSEDDYAQSFIAIHANKNE